MTDDQKNNISPQEDSQPVNQEPSQGMTEDIPPAVVETGEPALTPAPQEQPASEPSPASAQETTAPAVVETGEPAPTPAPQEQPARSLLPASAQETAAPAVVETGEPRPYPSSPGAVCPRSLLRQALRRLPPLPKRKMQSPPLGKNLSR